MGLKGANRNDSARGTPFTPNKAGTAHACDASGSSEVATIFTRCSRRIQGVVQLELYGVVIGASSHYDDISKRSPKLEVDILLKAQ